MKNQDLELVCVLNAISEVAERLSEKKHDEEMKYNFDRLSKVTNIMAKCAKLGVSDNVMLCSLKARGLISNEEFKEFISMTD